MITVWLVRIATIRPVTNVIWMRNQIHRVKSLLRELMKRWRNSANKPATVPYSDRKQATKTPGNEEETHQKNKNVRTDIFYIKVHVNVLEYNTTVPQQRSPRHGCRWRKWLTPIRAWTVCFSLTWCSGIRVQTPFGIHFVQSRFLFLNRTIWNGTRVGVAMPTWSCWFLFLFSRFGRTHFNRFDFLFGHGGGSLVVGRCSSLEFWGSWKLLGWVPSKQQKQSNCLLRIDPNATIELR